MPGERASFNLRISTWYSTTHCDCGVGAQLPVLRRWGGFPHAESVVVLDNFTTHKNAAFVNLVLNNNGIVEHLPPYSPDLNPVSCSSRVLLPCCVCLMRACTERLICQIETVFSSMKAWLRRHRHWVANVDGLVAINQALLSITPEVGGWRCTLIPGFTAFGFRARFSNVGECFQVLLSISTCALAPRRAGT
jgi:hypothetical protein